MSDSERIVTVEIQGQRYPIRTALEPDYVVRLARYLDAKLKAAAETQSTSDTERLTIIAALNIADELLRCREQSQDRDGHLAARAHELEEMVDRLLIV